MQSLNPFKFSKENPLVLVNFKNFKEGTGLSGLKLAKSMGEAQRRLKIRIGVSVESFLVGPTSEFKGVMIFGQHVDGVEFGSNTGSILCESMLGAGAVGSLLNHSEKRVEAGAIESAIARMRTVGLVSVLCVESIDEVARYAAFGPDFIAIEPPELIGGDISVSTARPELISEAVEAAGEIPILVGAGIKNGQDLRVALDLGAVGILVASGVCKAEDPIKVLEDFNSVV